MLDQLEDLELTGRTDWLAVPLPTTRRQAVGEAVRAARAEVAWQLGLLPAPVSAREEAERLGQAAKMAAAWPSAISLRPASEAEILWIYGHSARRGVTEPLLPEGGKAHTVRGRGRGVAALGQVLLSEGSVASAEGERPAKLRSAGQVFGRRWLQSTTEWGTSYQAMLALAEMPESFLFPGSEYLVDLDGFPYPVDWVVRLDVTDGASAEAKSRRQARELANQYNEYAEETAGVPAAVDKSAAGLDEYRERLTASATEVEVRAMVALCVWGSTPDEAEQRATELAGHFATSEYVFARPRGEMENLWYGMLPGARTPKVMAQYAQYLLARDFAMAGPFSAGGLGGESGPLYGLQLAGGGLRPVFVDWARGLRDNVSPSIACVGEVGAGKSFALKAAMYLVLAAGRMLGKPRSRGRAIVVDRTPQQEWVRFARACPGKTDVIGAVFDSLAVGERTLATRLLPLVERGTLLLADRGFPSFALFTAATARGAELLWRVSASFTLPVEKVLADGTYLSHLNGPRGSGVTVRVVEYTVDTADEDTGEIVSSELFCLITTLLDPETAPAAELAELYARRWTSETIYRSIKVEQRGGRTATLRSNSPDMVAQELWAMLCV
ncbi:transposase [Streptomyces sp. NPDC057910]|uniref:transposase n=1 Tax=Streptomyces sp. NPDC057910 TaxID=3346278 RepID=UPI0036F0CC62